MREIKRGKLTFAEMHLEKLVNTGSTEKELQPEGNLRPH